MLVDWEGDARASSVVGWGRCIVSVLALATSISPSSFSSCCCVLVSSVDVLSSEIERECVFVSASVSVLVAEYMLALSENCVAVGELSCGVSGRWEAGRERVDTLASKRDLQKDGGRGR